jgi:hypothetical protein
MLFRSGCFFSSDLARAEAVGTLIKRFSPIIASDSAPV